MLCMASLLNSTTHTYNSKAPFFFFSPLSDVNMENTEIHIYFEKQNNNYRPDAWLYAKELFFFLRDSNKHVRLSLEQFK